MAEFPLWRLRPEDAARIIILEPLRPVEHHKFWRKRDMRIKSDNRGTGAAPKPYDLKALDKAKDAEYWERFAELWHKEFPVFRVMVGPMLRNGRFFSEIEKVANPLAAERQREPWQGMYSREQFEIDVAQLEKARALLRENYILGQQQEGPYLDGLVFMRADNLLLAEIERCKNRLRMTWAIIEQRRLAKQIAKPKAKKRETWQTIKDETVAMKFKQSGYTVQYLGMHNYRVLVK